jgi:peptidylprolyl isomerase
VKIPPEEAYGPRRQEMVMEVERRCIPQEFEPEVGQVLQIGGSRERMLQVAVSEVTESSVFLDANHPLAGKALLFEVEMVEILGSRRDGKDEGTEETQEKQEMEEMEEMRG